MIPFQIMTHPKPTHPTKTMPNPNDRADSLADLFAESDRVGDKYLTDDEIDTRDRDLDQETDAANAAIDELFPDL